MPKGLDDANVLCEPDAPILNTNRQLSTTQPQHRLSVELAQLTEAAVERQRCEAVEPEEKRRVLPLLMQRRRVVFFCDVFGGLR
jgi:hypothetical protein